MKRSHWLGLSVVLVAASVCMAWADGEAASRAGPEGFVYRSIEVDGRTYPYTIYRPRGLKDPGRGLVFLHGYGECGVDGSKPLAVGLPPAMMLEPERWPFVVLIPQKPTGEEEWEDHESAVLAMLDGMIAEEGVDADRVAITGLSQGGHGTIRFASNHPGRFRAAAPVCGYVAPWWDGGERGALRLPEGDEARALAASFSGTPVWLFHGKRDEVVSAEQSEWLHGRLEDAGHDTKLTIFPRAGHNAWDPAYRTSGLWDWLVEMTAPR
jgi:predicted peptidase